MKFKTQLADLLGDEFTRCARSKNPSVEVSEMVQVLSIAYGKMLALSCLGKAEQLEKLLPDVEEIVRKSARFGLTDARTLTTSEEPTND
jgi:hypothetical protein